MCAMHSCFDLISFHPAELHDRTRHSSVLNYVGACDDESALHVPVATIGNKARFGGRAIVVTHFLHLLTGLWSVRSTAARRLKNGPYI